MRHPHADLIHAWAEGAELEYFDFTGWKLATNLQWDPNTQYRIKPKTSDWFNNIPKHGVLCLVNGHGSNSMPHIQVITRYKPDERTPFVNKLGRSWVYATPLTNEEIKQFLRGEE